LFRQFIQAGFKVGQLSRGDLLTTLRTTLHLHLSFLRVATQALQLDPQLIDRSINARQILSRSTLGLFELCHTIAHLLHPCRYRLVLCATLTLQSGCVRMQRLQRCIPRTAHDQAGQQ
jgi:hypothetical protein